MTSNRWPHSDVAVPHALTFILDRLSHAIFFLGADRRFIHANDAGRQLIERHTSLFVRGGQLCAADASVTKRLGQLVAAALESADGIGGALAIERSAPLLPMVGSVLADPGSARQTPSTACAVLVVSDPDAGHSRGLFEATTAFRLTRTETLVVSKFIDWCSLSEVANALCMQPSTVRTHLKHAMAKTGTRKQSDLVRVLLAGSPPLR